MDNEIIYNVMLRSCSVRRLEAYRATTRSNEELLSLYFWNIELSKELLVVFHLLEVAMRNELHERIKLFYRDKSGYGGTGDWFEDNGLINSEEERRVESAKSKFLKRNGLFPQEDQLIAELSFGFWVALFRGAYEHKSSNYKGLWPHLWKPLRFFQKCPKQNRNRQHFSALLEPLRDLRNRVAHHEPIYNRQTLLSEYHDVVTLLGWIDPLLVEQLNAICEFEQVYHRGAAACRWMRARAVTPETP